MSDSRCWKSCEPRKRLTASSWVRPIDTANWGAMSIADPSRPAAAAARWMSSIPRVISSGESTAGIQPCAHCPARRRTSGWLPPA